MLLLEKSTIFKTCFGGLYENELKHFVGAVRGIHQVISTADEAVLRMRIVDAIYQSAAKKKEIYFK